MAGLDEEDKGYHEGISRDTGKQKGQRRQGKRLMQEEKGP